MNADYGVCAHLPRLVHKLRIDVSPIGVPADPRQFSRFRCDSSEFAIGPVRDVTFGDDEPVEVRGGAEPQRWSARQRGLRPALKAERRQQRLLSYAHPLEPSRRVWVDGPGTAPSNLPPAGNRNRAGHTVNEHIRIVHEIDAGLRPDRSRVGDDVLQFEPPGIPPWMGGSIVLGRSNSGSSPVNKRTST